MKSIRRTLAAASVAGAFLAAGMAAPAYAQQQDGLINVMVGDVTVLENVNIGVAAQLAAQVCGMKVGPVAILGTAVDRSGETTTVCNSAQGPVTLVQN